MTNLTTTADTRTIDVETLTLLRRVAEDAQHLIACNCSYDQDTPDAARCDGSCTHSMAVRALAALATKGQSS